jgi:hypothetical protein
MGNRLITPYRRYMLSCFAREGHISKIDLNVPDHPIIIN